MKAIYLDCFAGISGNMLLGAFLQAGVPEAYLLQELQKLPVHDEFQLVNSEVVKNGIHACYVDVQLTQAPGHEHNHMPPHDHAAVHGHAEASQAVAAHAHAHRTMADIRTMLEQSTLAMPVKQHAVAIFEALAVAEGRVHGKKPEAVAFHEVGAVDSIVDIVGTAICLDYLGIGQVFASRLNLGSGFVHCAHGLMPVPAPAVAELTKTFPTCQRQVEKELTTPTGAAVVQVLANYSESLPTGFVTQTIAYGAGTWELDIPNVLRMYVGEYQGAGTAERCILEANIDDMNPQLYGYLYEQLLAAGALDVWTTPIYMKKNRPAQMLSVLTDKAQQAELAGIIFRESTSIGLRVVPVQARLECSRRTAQVETPYGQVACKASAWQGQLVNVSAEYDDCRRLAEAQGVPLRQVQRATIEAFYARLGK